MSHMLIDILEAIKQTFIALAGWIFGFPLSLMIKRNQNLIVVMSSQGSSFADNSKYFYVYSEYLVQAGKRIVYLTGNYNVKDLINNAGGESVIHPSWRSIFLLLKCGIFVTDWVIFNIYPIICGAKYIQIWHGAPLKHIELDLFHKRLETELSWMRIILRIQKKIIGRYPTYNLLVATSKGFISSAFRTCMNARISIASGYPRDDILFDWDYLDPKKKRLASINVDQQAIDKAIAAKSNGSNVCLYVPTFRRDMSNPFETQVNLKRLSAFAQKYNLFIILKLHKLMYGRYSIESYPHIIEYSSLGDIYPIMPYSDFLITDYSSIFFDYLLFDRPIIFFAYDLDSYISKDRNMYFDYFSMTPGIKCTSYDELEKNLELLLKSECIDQYADFRKKITAFTHDHIDNKAHQRLYDEILNL